MQGGNAGGLQAGFRSKRGTARWPQSYARGPARRFALKSAGSFDPALRGLPGSPGTHPLRTRYAPATHPLRTRPPRRTR
ncbi:hypothetical protein CBM2623_B170394 [Cupriavidus taiwanensis]|nr:hypothetical protein CBM2617_B190062 [Cupriavidus taiwanensis]SOZ83388.1 hypothetical protein CBM2618_B10062 [Cupriavidus taiwanensis]SOZ85937.1 hypothetical protein CBM2622_B10061 [Cupriavidus taiwanensis]SOZ92774.1 hypothetical protein CBM2621_B10061 [Cupriavidus taiwanensis]SPA33350.1 hypothetical protein CBM2623_B170394 [Cupriavidus taiwanensis]